MFRGVWKIGYEYKTIIFWIYNERIHSLQIWCIYIFLHNLIFFTEINLQNQHFANIALLKKVDFPGRNVTKETRFSYSAPSGCGNQVLDLFGI